MNKTWKAMCISAMLVLTSGLSLSAAAQDQDVAGNKDPERWYNEDLTVQARQQTLRKEAGAAYKEAQTECKRAAGADRSACMREARANYENDLANARALTAR